MSQELTSFIRLAIIGAIALVLIFFAWCFFSSVWEQRSVHTRLVYACGGGSADLDQVKALVAKGADVNRPARFVSGWTPLVAAAAFDNTNIVEYLLEKGADVNARVPGGQTALMWTQSEFVAKKLIKKGADINAKDNHGSTPLGYAIGSSRTDVVQVLREAGAKQ